MYNFEASLINSLRFPEGLRLSLLSLAIFRRKRKSKIFEFENAMEKGIRKILTFVKL